MNGHSIKANGTASGQSYTQKTDYSRWRLKDDRGAQTWHYIDPEDKDRWPQSTADKYHLGLPTVGRSLLNIPDVH